LYNQSLVIACVSHISDSQCALQDSQQNHRSFTRVLVAG
jgi:hypothetical protein